MKTIVMIGPSPASKGGMATVIKNLLNAPRLAEPGMLFIPTQVDGNRFRKVAVCVFALIKLLYLLLVRRVTLLHVHVASGNSFLRKTLFIWLAYLARCPVVLHLHGSEFRGFYEQKLGWAGRWLVKRSMEKAASVVALSTSWSQWLQEGLGLVNVVVIHNGVPELMQSRDDVSPVPRILFLGQLGARKGADTLIDAMKKVVLQVPSAVLEFGGDGNLELYRCQAKSLSENVRFLGWINDHEKAEALRRASVLCLPSWNEGLPMSVLEAMGAGLPVITTPVGGIPEAVKHGINGYLVQPGDVNCLADQIIRVLRDPDLQHRLGAEGKRIHAERFSEEAMAKAFEELYRSCAVA